MKFRIGRHLDVKMISGLRANERHQFVGIVKFADAVHAGGQIAAQRDDAPDAHIPVGVQHRADVLARGADAGQVGSGVIALGLDLPYSFQRAVLRGATRAEGDGKKFRLERRELPARGREFFHTFRSLWRKEFKTEKLPGHKNLIPFSFAIWLIYYVSSSIVRQPTTAPRKKYCKAPRPIRRARNCPRQNRATPNRPARTMPR